jgi:hypothetical protein
MPAPAPTELLAEELRRLEESNQRLAEAVHGLGRDLGSFRADVAEKFGTLNANLEGFRGRAETSLSVARWGVRVLTPLIIGLVGVVITAAWYGGWNASALNFEVKQLGQRIDSEAKRVEQRIDQIDRRLESIRILLESSRNPAKN